MMWRSRKSFAGGLWWGAKYAFWPVAFFSALATVLVWLSLGELASERPVGFGTMVGSYCLASVLAGALAGVVDAKSRVGHNRALIAAFGVVPFALGVGLLFFLARGAPARPPWYPFYVAGAAMLLSSLFGLGLLCRIGARQSRSPAAAEIGVQETE